MPTCSNCRNPSVIFQRHAGLELCRDHFLRSFERRAKHEIAKQGMLPNGLTVVALSGGKDSVAVLHFLAGMTKDNPKIQLAAVTVDEGIAGYRGSALDICREVTTNLGIPWHVVATDELAGYTIDQYAAGTHGPANEEKTGQPRPACGACGVFRRVGMNKLARELGAAAIVTGHNLDDQAQTVLMNYLKGDVERMARLAPHITGERKQHPGLVPRLIPLRTIPEKEVLLYALLNDLPLHDEAECPYAARSHRFALRDIVMGLEAQTPGTRHALVKGHERLKPILVAALPSTPMLECPSCGEPTSGAACTACSFRA